MFDVIDGEVASIDAEDFDDVVRCSSRWRRLAMLESIEVSVNGLGPLCGGFGCR